MQSREIQRELLESQNTRRLRLTYRQNLYFVVACEENDLEELKVRTLERQCITFVVSISCTTEDISFYVPEQAGMERFIRDLTPNIFPPTRYERRLIERLLVQSKDPQSQAKENEKGNMKK